MNEVCDRGPVVIMDVDGVVYDFVGQLAVGAAAELGCSASKLQPAEVWDFMTEQWGWTLEEFFDRYERCVESHGLCRDGVPLPGSLAGWSKLRCLASRC